MDLNKSPLTHEVTRVASLWLEAAGFKPVESEVYMPYRGDKGWVADLAAVICPTQTELIDLGLVPRKPRWKYPSTQEYQVKCDAWQLNYENFRLNLNHGSLTALVEVKTTRADFRGDRKWKEVCPANLAYLAIPSGIVKPEEYPKGWGVLEYLEDGTMRRRAVPTPCIHGKDEFTKILYQIAIRRDHHTRYARWREISQQQRIDDRQERTFSNVGDIVKLVFKVARAGDATLEQLIEKETKLSDLLRKAPWWRSEFEQLLGIAKTQEAGQ